MRFRLLSFVLLILQLSPQYAIEISQSDEQSDGTSNLNEGKRLHQLARYEEAAPYFWRAVLAHSSTEGTL